MMLLGILQLYPVLTTGYHRAASGKGANELEATQKLLEEAMGEQVKENKANVQAFIHDTGRFQETDANVEFSMATGEAEWLLQVLNDIRVGSWVSLGCPTPDKQLTELTEEQARSLWVMDVTALFQNELLKALRASPL
jgi:hypothetical protein